MNSKILGVFSWHQHSQLCERQKNTSIGLMKKQRYNNSSLMLIIRRILLLPKLYTNHVAKSLTVLQDKMIYDYKAIDLCNPYLFWEYPNQLPFWILLWEHWTSLNLFLRGQFYKRYWPFQFSFIDLHFAIRASSPNSVASPFLKLP